MLIKLTSIKYSALACCLLILCACGGGGGGGSNTSAPVETPPPPSPTPPPPAPSTAAQDLALALEGQSIQDIISIASRALALRDPQNVLADGLADEYGLTGVKLTDISFEYRNTTFDMWQVTRDALDEFDSYVLPDESAFSLRIFNWLIDSALAQREFMHYDYQATYFITSVPSRLERFFADLHPLESPQDARDYITRLRQVDDTIRQLVVNLRAMEDEGVIEPALTLRISANVHKSSAAQSISSNPYYQGVRNRLAEIEALSGEQRSDIQSQARDIISAEIVPAYESLVAFMESQLPRAPNRIGVSQYPKGEAYYRERLRFHTTTSLDADEIHQLGLRELARVHAEQRVLFDQLGYPQGEGRQQLFDRVARDGGFVAASDAVARYESLIDDAQARMSVLFEKLPETQVVVIGGDSGGFYISASRDGSRPGAFYASTTSSQPYYTMPSLAYHEAMPGHHMQIALSQELNLPEFRRGLTFTGFVEGWALYAERLAGEYGWYEGDIYGDLGRLYFEGLRAARLVVDTGIHSRGWSFDRAVSFFQENVGTSLRSAQSNISRYALYPGQATAYMVGMLKILELRETMREALGENFSIVEFHNATLNNGSLPLELLESRIAQEISLSSN